MFLHSGFLFTFGGTARIMDTLNFLINRYGLKPVTDKGYFTKDYITLVHLYAQCICKDRHPVTGEILDYE